MGLFNHEAANRAVDTSGAPVGNAVRKIYPKGAVSNAPAYQDPDLTIMRVSDMKSDSAGYFDLCYIQDGEYRVEIESPQGEVLYSAEGVIVGSHLRTQELDEYTSTDQLQGDVFLSYGEETGRYTVRPGQKIVICSTDIQYKVMPEDESAPHLVSAGGVRFCQTGTRYTDLNCFEQAVARGESFSAGTMAFVGGTIFTFDDDGNTTLPGLPGWRRVVAPENDAHLTQSKAKTDLLTVSQSVNLDVIPALVAGSHTYDSVSAGLAGTSDGETFFVATGPGLQVYRNDSGAGSFLGWYGDVLFDDVASLSATTDLLPEGVIVRTRQEGHAYKVAASGASDHHVTFGPNKLYVLPQGGEYHLAAWNVEGTGASNDQDAFEAALEQAMADDLPLVLSQKEILLDGNNIFADLPEGKRLLLRSPCGTTVRTTNMNLKFRGAAARFTEDLAADVARYGTQVTVSDTTGIKHGDLVYFVNTQARIDSNWNYAKYCIRRVQAVIDGTTIELDQPMDMHFHRWEGNRNGRTVTAITQANPGVVTAPGFSLDEGDHIRLDFIEGMTELAGNVYRVGPVSGNSFDLHDENGNPVDTSAFGAYVADSAEVFEQGQTTVTIRPRALIDLDNINFLVGVNKVAISGIDVSTGQITTAAAHGLSTGDIINFQGVGGTTELNDQDYEVVRLSDTLFTLRDFDNIAIDTTGMTPYTGGGYIHSSAGDYSSTITFDYISGSVRRCSFVGAIPGWLPGTVDTVRVTASDGVDFDLCHFERGRYCPLIQAGARNTKVRRSTVSKIRHIDIAGWAQDTLIEDVTGNDTDGIIESHPNIRPVWRRIRDSVRHSLNSAIDIRGVGEIVEDCKSWSTSGINVGTQEFTPVRAYEDWTASFTRRITGFESRTGCISAANFSPMIVERCDVPYISAGGTAPVYVDDHTKISAPQDRSVETAFSQIVMPHRVDLPKTTVYASERRRATITDITQANPAVVTATAHGFETGDLIVFEDMTGMDELYGKNHTVTVIDQDSFSINRNATGYGAYISGGTAWADAPIRDISGITQANPGVVTAAGHGFSDGDVVWLSGVSGMTAINQGYYIVAGATTDTFALTDLDGADVDTTGYTAYSSGGKVTRQALYDTIDLATKPNVGLGGVALTSTRLYAETAHSGTTVEVPCNLRVHAPGAVKNENYHVQIVLKAMTRGGYAESRYNVIMEERNNAAAYNFAAFAENDGMGGSSVYLKGISIRALSRVDDEGEGSTTQALKPEVNERWGIAGLIVVELDSSSDFVLSLDVDLDVRTI